MVIFWKHHIPQHRILISLLIWGSDFPHVNRRASMNYASAICSLCLSHCWKHTACRGIKDRYKPQLHFLPTSIHEQCIVEEECKWDCWKCIWLDWLLWVHNYVEFSVRCRTRTDIILACNYGMCILLVMKWTNRQLSRVYLTYYVKYLVYRLRQF